MQRVEQLSFDVFPEGRKPRWQNGEERGPDALALSITGKFNPRDAMPNIDGDERLPELYHGEYVTVQIVSEDGEIIAAGHGKVSIAFKDTTVQEMPITVREQKIKLGG